MSVAARAQMLKLASFLQTCDCLLSTRRFLIFWKLRCLKLIQAGGFSFVESSATVGTSIVCVDQRAFGSMTFRVLSRPGEIINVLKLWGSVMFRFTGSLWTSYSVTCEALRIMGRKSKLGFVLVEATLRRPASIFENRVAPIG